jgi:hypothetical protein
MLRRNPFAALSVKRLKGVDASKLQSMTKADTMHSEDVEDEESSKARHPSGNPSSPSIPTPSNALERTNERKKARQKDRKTERHKDRKNEREKEKKKERERERNK